MGMRKHADTCIVTAEYHRQEQTYICTKTSHVRIQGGKDSIFCRFISFRSTLIAWVQEKAEKSTHATDFRSFHGFWIPSVRVGRKIRPHALEKPASNQCQTSASLTHHKSTPSPPYRCPQCDSFRDPEHKNGTTDICNAVFCGERGIRTPGTVTRTSV